MELTYIKMDETNNAWEWNSVLCVCYISFYMTTNLKYVYIPYVTTYDSYPMECTILFCLEDVESVITIVRERNIEIATASNIACSAMGTIFLSTSIQLGCIMKITIWIWDKLICLSSVVWDIIKRALVFLLTWCNTISCFTTDILSLTRHVVLALAFSALSSRAAVKQDTHHALMSIAPIIISST